MLSPFSEKYTWRFLKNLGNSKLIKSSYYWIVAVPLLANLLQKLPDVIQIELLGNRYDLVFKLPFSWSLFYFSALAFSAASFIFDLRCPTLVKKFKSYADAEAIDAITNFQIMLQLKDILDKKALDEKSLGHIRNITVKHFLKEDLSTEGENWLHTAIQKDIYIKEDKVIDAFNFTYNNWSKSYVYSRTCCLIFYFTGMLLMFIVFAQNLISTVRVILKTEPSFSQFLGI